MFNLDNVWGAAIHGVVQAGILIEIPSTYLHHTRPTLQTYTQTASKRGNCAL